MDSLLQLETKIKAELSPCKKAVFICFYESPLKMMKNAFYFMLETLFIPKIFKYLSSLFGYVEKRLNEKAKVDFKIYDVTN